MAIEPILENFYSWKIKNDSVALKKVDKSVFLHHGSGIPHEMMSHFNIIQTDTFYKRNVKLAYNHVEYNAHFQMSEDNRFRLFWNADFVKLLIERLPESYRILTQDAEYDEAKIGFIQFKTVNDTYYEVEFINPAQRNYWIFKVGDQDKYADIIGEKYSYDNTHSVKLAKGDSFIYLSTRKNRYDFIGYGQVESLEKRNPSAQEKRNDRVNTIFSAKLANVHLFAEPLDFTPHAGKLNRAAVGIGDALAWGISMPRISEELYTKIIQLAQPEEKGRGLGSHQIKGEPSKAWIDPNDSTDKYFENHSVDISDFEPNNFDDARDKTLRSLFVRRGQPKFRKQLIEAYDSKCAITGCDVTNVLQAAHIYPYRGNDTNSVTNGMLLRSDIHDLFDLGLITVDTSTMTVIVSEKLRNSQYASLNGVKLKLPSNKLYQPNRVYLDYHREWWKKTDM